MSQLTFLQQQCFFNQPNNNDLPHIPKIVSVNTHRDQVDANSKLNSK